MLIRAFLFFMVVSLVGCAEADDDLAARSNAAPQASLRAPVLAPLGFGLTCAHDEDCVAPRGCSTGSPLPRCEIRFDASDSIDYNADPLIFTFHYNDGSEPTSSSNPVAFHSFDGEAVYEVVVRVVDMRGAESLASQDVSIRNDFPNPPDFCGPGNDCVADYECDAGVCYANGGMFE